MFAPWYVPCANIIIKLERLSMLIDMLDIEIELLSDHLR